MRGDALIRLWDPATGKQRNRLPAHDGWVTTLAFAPDGKTLISGSIDETIRDWNSATGELLWTRTVHPGGVDHVAVLPDGRALLSCGQDDRFCVTDLATIREQRRFDSAGDVPDVRRVIGRGLSQDGRTVCTCTVARDGNLYIYQS